MSTENRNPRFADFEAHLMCRCDHASADHARGWGACKFVIVTPMVLHAEHYAMVERCECARFVSSNHPAGKGL